MRPVVELHTAAQQLELDTAGDSAAVLDWRLDDTRLHNSPAPLPWLPGIPGRIANSPEWGPYLAARAQLITDLADQVRAYSEAATWAAEHDRVLPPDLITDLQVWRAAMQVEPADLRPTGPEQRSVLARTWQHRLNRRLGTHDTPQDQQWAELLAEQIPNLINDSFLPSLTNRLRNFGPRRPRHDQSGSIGNRQSTVTRRPPGSRPLVAHPRRAPYTAAKPPRSSTTAWRAGPGSNQTQTAAISSAENTTFNNRSEPLNRP